MGHRQALSNYCTVSIVYWYIILANGVDRVFWYLQGLSMYNVTFRDYPSNKSTFSTFWPAHEIENLSHMCKSPLNAHRGLNFGMSPYLSSYFVVTSSEGSGESTRLRRLARSFDDQNGTSTKI